MLATWRRNISKADIAGRVRPGAGSRNKDPGQRTFLIKVLLFPDGQMLLLRLADRFESTEGRKMGVRGTFLRGEILFLILRFLIEITVNWNTLFGA